MSRFLTEPPLWVWPLFVLLLVVGLRARRDRWAPLMLIYCLPLLGISGLMTILALPAPRWIIGVFAVAYSVGAVIGYAAQKRWTGARQGALVHLRGESWTLATMMLIFWANFVGGFLAAVAPDLQSGLIFQCSFVSIVAACSGSFTGRALQIWRA